MDLQAILNFVIANFEAIANAADPKAELCNRVGLAYDEVILPLDLPGPDSILDPLLRGAATAAAGAIYDAIAARIAAGETPEAALSAMAAAMRPKSEA